MKLSMHGPRVFDMSNLKKKFHYMIPQVGKVYIPCSNDQCYINDPLNLAISDEYCYTTSTILPVESEY